MQNDRILLIVLICLVTFSNGTGTSSIKEHGMVRTTGTTSSNHNLVDGDVSISSSHEISALTKNLFAKNKNETSSTTILVQEEDTTWRTPRIVGGALATADFPFFAWTAGSIPPCGGTIIWPDIVLTSASCGGKFLSGIHVGGLSLSGTGAEVKSVVAELIHTRFDSVTLENDLMLVKLDSASTAIPVTLNYNPAIPTTNDPLTIIGYGATAEFGLASDQLLQGTVNVVSTANCNAFWGTRVDTSLQLCAGVETGAVDICEGDEGGPLLTPTGTQVGIISYTSGCGQANTPAVFTRISAYETWIKRGICDLSSTLPPAANCPPTSNPKPVTIRPTAKLTSKPTIKPSVKPKVMLAPTKKPAMSKPTRKPIRRKKPRCYRRRCPKMK